MMKTKENQISMRMIIAMFCLIFSLQLSAAQRGRVQIVNNNVVTDTNEPIRACPFFLDLFDVPDMQANETLYRNYFKTLSETYNMNAIRICPWIGDWTYDVKNNSHHNEMFVYMIDKVVDWCEEDGIYAIVDLHIEFGTTVDLQNVKDFWSVFAPRYKDKTHVVFEALNEPDVTTAIQQMGNVYTYIRNQAPNTHIILWSPNNATKITLNNIQSVSSIDYSNASFGFHVYEWYVDKPVEWEHAKSIRDAGYPVICTEFFSITNANYMPIDYDHLVDNIDYAEQYGMSWMQWGPFAQYRNNNKSGWTHNSIKFSQTYLDELAQGGVAHWEIDNGTTTGGNLSGIYRIKDNSEGRYITASNETADWSTVNTVWWQDWQSQKWELVHVEDNIYRIKNTWSGFYITAPNQYTEWDAVRQHSWENWTSQQWIFEQIDGEEYRITNRWNGMVLRAQNNNWWDVVQTNNHNYNTERWRVEFYSNKSAVVETGVTANVIECEMYPNPASEIISLKIDEPCQLTIYNIDGQVIYSQFTDRGVQSINTSAFAEGVYVVRLTNNMVSFSQKLMIKHN